MEKNDLNFDEYEFDSSPYIISVNSFKEHIQQSHTEDATHSKNKIYQTDLLINEKLEECCQIAEEIGKSRSDNLGMQMELDKLKKTEDHLLSTNFDLKDALKNICKSTFVKNNEDFRVLTQKIQMNLGFKLKLLQCQEKHMWTATFFFDHLNNLDGSHFIILFYNSQEESFILRDIKPKPIRFVEMANFLKNTNDVTGLLYNCWEYFSMKLSQS